MSINKILIAVALLGLLALISCHRTAPGEETIPPEIEASTANTHKSLSSRWSREIVYVDGQPQQILFDTEMQVQCIRPADNNQLPWACVKI